jgi:hypothetical protein
MKTFHVYENIARSEFFLQWEAFQIKVVEEIKTHFIFSNFFRKYAFF